MAKSTSGKGAADETAVLDHVDTSAGAVEALLNQAAERRDAPDSPRQGAKGCRPNGITRRD
jgi:hypothetical protein